MTPWISVAKDERLPELVERYDLAERVAALIGASALAVHQYVRATNDIDLATVVDPYRDLGRLEKALRAAGFKTKLNLPDDDDPLGGVLRVWTREDEDGDPIENVDLVNFNNPFRPRPTPARDAIRDAIVLPERPALRCVRLAPLIAIKLDSGGLQDLADVVEVLRRNREADRDEIRALCKKFGLDVIDRLIEQADA